MTKDKSISNSLKYGENYSDANAFGYMLQYGTCPLPALFTKEGSIKIYIQLHLPHDHLLDHGIAATLQS